MLLGSDIAPISPWVASVRMLNLIEKRYGEKNNVPKIILAGSSIDDIFVIIFFMLLFLWLNPLILRQKHF